MHCKHIFQVLTVQVLCWVLINKQDWAHIPTASRTASVLLEHAVSDIQGQGDQVPTMLQAIL